MEDIFKGFKKFKSGDFLALEGSFKDLKDTQQPHTLFIGCSDSRLIPTLITQSGPGELFVIRNIANVIPPYDSEPAHISTSSAIEYALHILKVKSIIVCGHSNCGGCKATFFDESDLVHLPHTKKWISLVKPAREKAELEAKENNSPEELTVLVEKQNIRNQVENLKSYPTVNERIKSGELQLHGWYFDIEGAKVFNLNLETQDFEKLD